MWLQSPFHEGMAIKLMPSLPAIIPTPAKCERQPGCHALQPSTKILAAPELMPVALVLQTALRGATSWAFEIETATDETLADPLLRSCISLALDQKNPLPESYRLEVAWWVIQIHAGDPAGAFYAVQTLLQLLPPAVYQAVARMDIAWSLPCLMIEDSPRFRWRGIMLDSSRYFQPVGFIKKFIDLLALHKLNIFHWHLTDDQGWRIEIKKYPRLTEIGAWRSESPLGHFAHFLGGDGVPHGGVYTQDQIREIVAYAAERFVTIVPEIEMPGHAQSAIAAYPDLGCTGNKLNVSTAWGVHENLFNPDESTVEFLQNVLDEVLALFPGVFIHVGGDEAKKTQWRNCPAVTARMTELGIEDVDSLQSWFIGRMATYLAGRGRRLIGWDEILEGGLPPGSTVMSWQGIEGGIVAANAGHDVVMAPKQATYFDFYQSLDTACEPLAIGGCLPLEMVYSYDPVPAEVSAANAARILGAQGQIWTEYMATTAHVEYMAFPRLCALAEVVWSLQATRDFENFRHRLATHLKRLDRLGVHYRSPGDPYSGAM